MIHPLDAHTICIAEHYTQNFVFNGEYSTNRSLRLMLEQSLCIRAAQLLGCIAWHFLGVCGLNCVGVCWVYIH